MVDNRDRIKALLAAKLKEKRAQGGTAGSSRQKAPVKRAASQSKPVRRPTTPQFLGKVVVADSDKRLQTLLANAVKALRFEPVTTDNGMEAVMYLQVETPVLVIVAQKLPDMSGADACSRIRELDNGLMVPVLMVTPDADRSYLQEAMDAGVTDCMARPINIAQFQQKVKTLVGYDRLTGR